MQQPDLQVRVDVRLDIEQMMETLSAEQIRAIMHGVADVLTASDRRQPACVSLEKGEPHGN